MISQAFWGLNQLRRIHLCSEFATNSKYSLTHTHDDDRVVTVPAVRWSIQWQCLPVGRSRSPWLSVPSAGSLRHSLGLLEQLLTHRHTLSITHQGRGHSVTNTFNVWFLAKMKAKNHTSLHSFRFPPGWRVIDPFLTRALERLSGRTSGCLLMLPESTECFGHTGCGKAESHLWDNK